MPDKPPAGRRIGAALRALTGRGPRTSTLLQMPEAAPAEDAEVVAEDGEAAPGAEVTAPADVPSQPSGEAAAARIDAARERLRATIAPPADEE